MPRLCYLTITPFDGVRILSIEALYKSKNPFNVSQLFGLGNTEKVFAFPYTLVAKLATPIL